MPTHYPGSPAEIRALNTYIGLTRAIQSLEMLVLDANRLEGLTPSQLGVLDTLRYLGPMCQKDIGGKILKSSGDLTLVINNLVKRGLVQRERQARDRRFVTVTLTKSGEALIDRIMLRHVTDVTQAMNILSAEEQETLGLLCKKLGKRLAEGRK
jgi:MarR family 2-MHQ and catechol resistance regulon transcriptional repressor